MVNRAQVMRPVEGGVVHQGWLHPGGLMNVRALFAEREFNVFAPHAIELPHVQADQPAASFLAKLLKGASRSSKTPVAIASVNGHLPFNNETQAMVWSPLWLHSVENPGQYMAEWLRVLKPEGGVFFSCFGPDTAQELRAFATELGCGMPDFADMHDLGDLMSEHGFSDPVMEMEKLTLTYTDTTKLLADWRALNGNILQDRSKGLFTPRLFSKAVQQLELCRNPKTGTIPLTLELVYGHAWKVKRKPKTSVATVKVTDIQGRKMQGKPTK